MNWVVGYVVLAWVIRVAMVPVVLRRQLAPGASLAWLGIVFLHPYIGFALYMMLGEARLGPRRVERHREIIAHYRGATAASLGGPCAGTAASQLVPTYGPIILQA